MNTCQSAGYFTGNQSGFDPLAGPSHSASDSCDTRSVNTQTPIFDNLLSDDSQSTSPEDEACGGPNLNASPRINKFLAREPPDGCEKIEQFRANFDLGHLPKPKPAGGFLLKPSLGSAFQPLQRSIVASPEIKDGGEEAGNLDPKDGGN
jgi:hypothetical protein